MKKKPQKTSRIRIVVMIVLTVLVIPFLMLWAAYTFPNQIRYAAALMDRAGSQLAAVFLSHNFKTVDDIKSRYSKSPYFSNTKVRILLVPGHEADYGGAEHGSLKERELTVDLARHLQGFLQEDSRYQVYVTRDGRDWSPVFTAYFKDNWEDILEWKRASMKEFSRLVAVGTIAPQPPQVYHNYVVKDVGNRLFGINKWANENDIDIAIHIHFNDNPNHRGDIANHSGFAIYVPASQYGNSSTTKIIADSIFKHLSKYNPVSNLPAEASGIIDEPELIAIGASNTSDAASMLIEYSYIYEPQIADGVLRGPIVKDLAYETFLGLEDFFDPDKVSQDDNPYDTTMLPHAWDKIGSLGTEPSIDILALQTAFIADGVYPPQGKTLNDCPRTGSFGACTKAALRTFQAKRGITGESGAIGPKTMEALNLDY